jgi:mannose-6-phosphate isomerase-like protein (cupin superfamily)
MNGISTRVHWSDQPYVWHVNDGQEVFVVLDGRVRMRYRKDGAEPLGVARVLVIETEGSL